jgi:hypothetical protein
MVKDQVAGKQVWDDRWVGTGTSQFLGDRFQPGRAKENSPAFQRWDGAPGWRKSRQGRVNGRWTAGSLSSPTGLVPFALPQPSVETMGYFLPPCRAGNGRARNGDASGEPGAL